MKNLIKGYLNYFSDFKEFVCNFYISLGIICTGILLIIINRIIG